LKQEANRKQKITKKNQTIHTKMRCLRTMTSKNQVRRVSDFICPSLEFPLSQIGEKKTADRFQALNSKNSKIMKKGIKYEQQGVYFLGGSISKVNGRIIKSQSSLASKKQGLDLQKMLFLKRFCTKRGWCSDERDTRAI
jgi:hypothetical protein